MYRPDHHLIFSSSRMLSRWWLVEVVEQGQTTFGALGVCDGDHASQLDRRCRRQPLEPQAQHRDLSPVGVAGLGGGVHSGDRSLDLVRTGRSTVPDAVDESCSLRDHVAIPLRGILLIEGYQFTGLGARRAARFGEQHQREQTRHLGIAGAGARMSELRGPSGTSSTGCAWAAARRRLLHGVLGDVEAPEPPSGHRDTRENRDQETMLCGSLHSICRQQFGPTY